MADSPTVVTQYPWDTSSSTPQTAPITPAPTTPGQSQTVAQYPWETQQPSSQGIVDTVSKYAGDYFSGLQHAWNDFHNTPISTKEAVSIPGQLAASAITGVVAPVAAMSQQWGEAVTGQPVTPYSEAKKNYMYQMTPGAAAVGQGIGAVLAPIPDAIHKATSLVTSDPEKQAMLSDSINTALTFTGAGVGGTALKTGEAAATDAIKLAPSFEKSIADTNALGLKYGINYTKGQLFDAAADDFPNLSAGDKGLLGLPYKSETRIAGTNQGKDFANHFADQQNILADHVQDVATQLRKSGNDTAADRIENSIIEQKAGLGLNAVDPRKLDTAINGANRSGVKLSDTLPQDTLTKLNDLHEISKDIKPVQPGEAATIPFVGKAIDVVGAGLGAAAGHVISDYFGIPPAVTELGTAYVGAKIASKVGVPYGENVFESRALKSNLPETGGFTPQQLSNMPVSQLQAMAKKAGISPDEMAMRLQRGTQ